ncbi:hypothetical protein COCNU_01G001640 [Cocos nucifera]|uniref:Uncharacterized protein n=1 Tax=Cocos nucifera TaxID=13894 RepID=A0A8K0MUA3_COCNU|nr:hypothetical protein COCNU_01G001640 [Cocos nucifera]
MALPPLAGPPTMVPLPLIFAATNHQSPPSREQGRRGQSGDLGVVLEVRSSGQDGCGWPLGEQGWHKQLGDQGVVLEARSSAQGGVVLKVQSSDRRAMRVAKGQCERPAGNASMDGWGAMQAADD